MARSATRTRPALTAGQLDVLRAALEDCRAERVEQLARLDGVEAHGDPVAVAHTASVRRVLGDVETALVRMAAGTYGACRHCDTAIPYARLEVLPYATGCVHCLDRRDESW